MSSSNFDDLSSIESDTTSDYKLDITQEQKESCENNIILFNNIGITDTLYPFVTTDEQIKNVVKMALYIEPSVKSSESIYNKDKFKSVMYKNMTLQSVLNTTDYIFNKMKTGVFVKIQNNNLVNFIPMYNINYTNDFSSLLQFREGNVQEYLRQKKQLYKYVPKVNYNLTKWNAVNCLLRNELDDKYPTQAYLSSMYKMLTEVCHHRKIEDCIFFLNRKDFPYLSIDRHEAYDHIYGKKELDEPYKSYSYAPILSQSTTYKHADIPIPTGDDWSLITQNYFSTNKDECKNDYILDDNIIPWNQRKPIVFWRGMSTGCGNTIETNPRLKVTKITQDLEDKGITYLDAGIVNFPKRDKKTIYSDFVEYYKNKEGIKLRPFVKKLDQMQYKFILNIEGNSAAYRFGSLFRLGFCVINVESKYKLWFEPLLENKVHYIQVKHDLSDLIETIEWCLKHDKECEQIAKNGMEFFKRYFNREFVYDYMSSTLNKIASMYDTQDYEKLVSYDDVKKIRAKIDETYKLKLEKIQLTSTSNSNDMIIIIPYRNNAYQNRFDQLKQFISKYSSYNILIVRQAKDNKKFNRGALLNIGYLWAKEKYSSFVFHDVDIMMPYDIINKYYTNTEHDIIHLGRLVRDYYDYNDFLGGVIKFSKKSFENINGFPNNFFGWGGEDDALKHRIVLNDYTVHIPNEQQQAYELKHKQTRSISDLTNLLKFENLILDNFNWKMNGINNIQYKILKEYQIDNKVHSITVELE